MRKDESGGPRGLNSAASCRRHRASARGQLNWKWLMSVAPLPLTGCLPGPDAPGSAWLTAEELGAFVGDFVRQILAALLL
jgi:hypothetical protein